MYALIVLLPLLTATIGGLFGRLIGDRAVMALTCAGLTVSAALSGFTFYHVAWLGEPGSTQMLLPWIQTGTFDVSFGVMVDKLTATMLVVVTGVSMCVHYYSIGYMAHDPSRTRFFSYLSLFTFTMLALVTAPNLLQMFLGWEGVGLASYLLIGFWFKRPSANAAAMKAFIVNRVADVGLLLALFTGFALFGTLDYADIFAQAPNLTEATFTFFGTEIPALSLFALFLLIGAMGKSAQFGFHTWLPDAMEGPTPVSALIHAATMVTAGVFLIARMSPVFELSGEVLTVVAWVGALTALFAATVGLTQKDIKRVIAYSTCSQLGYMFFACGVSAYPAAIFHLTTHAFFKALLFLSAGSVIHGMSDEQDMFKMGGIRKLLPVTHALMWIGSLALAGIPPFAGFFSKDLIIESALMSGTGTGTALYVVGTLGALLTAFYSFRVVFLTFYGKSRATKEVLHHAHESPAIMLAPMLLLAVGAITAGFLPMGNLEWWGSAIHIAEGHVGLEHSHHTPLFFKLLPLIVAVIGIAGAVWCYVKSPNIPEKTVKAAKPLYAFSFNKWYVDELYEAVIVRPYTLLAKHLWQTGDVNGIDRFGPNGAAWLARTVGSLTRRLQTGYVYHYAFGIVLGVCALLTWMMFVN